MQCFRIPLRNTYVMVMCIEHAVLCFGSCLVQGETRITSHLHHIATSDIAVSTDVVRRVQTSKFPVLYRPTELGAGPQRSATQHERHDLCDMLRDSRLVGLDNRAIWLQWCEYTISNNGVLPCHCPGDCGGYAPRLIFCGGNCPQ